MIINLDYEKVSLSDDDKITIFVKPLSYHDFQKVAFVISELSESGDSSSNAVIDGLKKLSNEKVLEISKDILPVYCKDLSGISIKEDGVTRDANIEDMTKHGAFAPITFQLITKLLSISSLKEEEVLKK